MIKIMLSILLVVTTLMRVNATDQVHPTMSDGFLGIAFDGIISASEAFIIYMIGAIISYRIAMYVTNRQLAHFQKVDSWLRNLVYLFEIYIKASIIPVFYAILAFSLLKLDKSFVLFDYCNEYVEITTIGVLFLLFVYVLLLPKHDNLEILSIKKSDCVKIYNSFSRIFISTVNLYCFLSLINKMKGIDYQTSDIVCRTIIAVHYMLEVWILKGTVHAISIRRKIAYVGIIAQFTRYINKKLWAILGLSILALYGHKIADSTPCFDSFICHMGTIVLTLLVMQFFAIGILEIATKYSLQMNHISVGKWALKFKKHIYTTANVANSLVYFAAFYFIMAYIFVDPAKFLADLNLLYATLKAAIQVYLIFFAYRCIDLFMAYKFECIYGRKEGRSKTLQSILPIIMQIVKIMIFVVGVLVVLANYNVDLTPVYTLVVGLGVPFSLAAKGTVVSFIKGFMMLIEDDLEIGNYVSVSGVKGIVEHIGLRTLKVREFNGTLHIIPYEVINIISNSSKDYTLHIVEAYCSNSMNINDFINVLHEVNTEVVENDNVRHLLTLERDFSFIRVKEFDEYGTKVTWGYATKPDIAGIFDCEFNNILKRKLTEKKMPYPKCLTRNGVNIAWSVYLDNK